MKYKDFKPHDSTEIPIPFPNFATITQMWPSTDLPKLPEDSDEDDDDDDITAAKSDKLEGNTSTGGTETDLENPEIVDDIIDDMVEEGMDVTDVLSLDPYFHGDL